MAMLVIHAAAIYSIHGSFLDKSGNTKFHSKFQYCTERLIYYSKLMPSINFFFHVM